MKVRILPGIHGFLLSGRRSDQLHQGGIPRREMRRRHLLGGRPQSLPHLQQFMVYFHGRRPLGAMDPSKANTHAPAANEDEDSGIVAIPHLSRDLLACYDGNGSNFGTHPQNVLRGMIYDTKTWEYPYLYNLIDQYRSLSKYNNGYAYNMMFVGPGWMNKMGRWEAPYELLKKSYWDGCVYYGQLKKEGKLVDMTMSEFADYYREKKTYTEPECALWRDILYGSNKQLFWYCDPYMRAGVNMDQGGAIFLICGHMWQSCIGLWASARPMCRTRATPS